MRTAEIAKTAKTAKKRLLSGFAAVLLLLAGCGGPQPPQEDSCEVQEATEITLWTFPVGNWGNPTTVASILASFHKEHPEIHVSVEYLTYANGDERMEQAIADGAMPDLVLEGPERLIAGWGDRGLMADLSDLWESDAAGAVYEDIRTACRHSSGAYYEIPLCMTAHCMAINYEMFEKSGALQYLDEETRTWTAEGFIHAVQALNEYDGGTIPAGIIYCANQSGDQGTRALVTNLYGGSFTDDAHTVYTLDREENIRALRLLQGLEGIEFRPDYGGTDAVEAFCREEAAMTFCWNVSQEVQQTINNPGIGFDIFPMAFPAETGVPELPCGIWGFGIFDKGDEARLAAAKVFIRFMTEDDAMYKRAVQASAYWPVREIGDIYVNDRLMEEYSIFMEHRGDYYQVTPNWTEARAAWWKALQAIGAGADAAEAVSGLF